MKRIFSLLVVILMLLTSGVAVMAAESEAEVDKESRLYKKCALFVGDSICEASNDGRNGWARRIIKWNSMRGVNAGKSAASVSTARGDNTIINQLKGQYKNRLQFDFVILHGGVNDAWENTPIGVMTEGFNDNYDVSTFAGGLEATIKYAKETFTNAKLGYIINFRQPLATAYGKLSNMGEYVDMTKQICDKWGVPYLDLYNDEVLNNELLKTNTREFVPDAVHPNTAGYDIISPFINDWMKTLAVEEVVEESVEESVESEIVEEAKDKSNTDVIVYSVCAIVVATAIVSLILFLKKEK